MHVNFVEAGHRLFWDDVCVPQHQAGPRQFWDDVCVCPDTRLAIKSASSQLCLFLSVFYMISVLVNVLVVSGISLTGNTQALRKTT